ncbi:hypothetical protein [Sphingomonas morindae]|uniref:Uncharacterized protein n=1 Tax=Sphingomonas morindae TaxID=1541170 RepID=A0ABY4X3A9_9SPHN|nr:hypothetical protein [Sphingomonas morindae]USI71382.1 hypothetical protein LHA26_08480 [Sphingomonas morindae]
MSQSPVRFSPAAPRLFQPAGRPPLRRFGRRRARRHPLLARTMAPAPVPAPARAPWLSAADLRFLATAYLCGLIFFFVMLS